MASRSTSWVYDFSGTTEDRRAVRTAVRPPASSLLRGIDGLNEGSLRPFPGFRTIWEFSPAQIGNATSLTDAFAVTFDVTDETSSYPDTGTSLEIKPAWGFVIRAGTNVYFQFATQQSDGINWVASTTPTTIKSSVSATAPMTVVSTGRLIFVFIEGEAPVSFYVSSPDFTSNYTVRIETDPGPGRRPKLEDYESSGALGSVASTPANYDGDGQIFLTEFLPSEVSLGLTQSDDDVRGLEPGDYAFAYVLQDSVTGRRTALSEIAYVRTPDFETVRLKCAMEIVYDSSKYDQAYIYRSVKTQDAGGTFTAGILHLEKIIELEDYHTSSQPAGDDARAIFFMELEDKSLVLQDIYTGSNFFDDNMPQVGAAYWFDNVMVVGGKEANVRTSTGDDIRKSDVTSGVGEIRWSDSGEISPELFPPHNRYQPVQKGSAPLLFKRAGSNLFGFSRDRQYVVRKQGSYLDVIPIHSGFGATGYKAADEVGSTVYFMTAKGLKTVDQNGALDEVRSLNKVALDEWAGSLDQVSLAYDPTVGALFVHNGAAEETVCVWFNSGMVTSLVDSTFGHVFRGTIPEDLYKKTSTTEFGNPLEERAIFVQNATTTSEKIRLMVLDYKRTSNTKGNLIPPYNISFQEDNPVSTIYTVDSAASNVIQVVETINTNRRNTGLYLYVVESATNPETVGKKAFIQSQSSTNEITLSTVKSEVSTLAPGDRFVVSPVFVEVVTYPVAVEAETEDGGRQVYSSAADFFRTRVVDGVQCYFTDVSGDNSGGTWARFQGVLYRGDDGSPTSVANTVAASDRSAKASVVDDDSSVAAVFGSSDGAGVAKHGVRGQALVPGIRIFMTGLDYRLIAMRVTGRVEVSTRTNRGGE